MSKLDVLAIRQKMGLSQKEFAKRCGVHWRTVQNWEKNPDAIPPTTTQFLCGLLDEQATIQDDSDSLPLIPIDAVAGLPGDDIDGVIGENCDRYHVPEFSAKGAQYLIRVSGTSMLPKYNNGDILACRKIDEITFFQWGKVYVMDTRQGALVKKVFPDPDNGENIICVSENKEEYPPFSLPKEEIRSLSIVVGVIGVE